MIRDHPATEVYVTGTFDDWAKSVKLEKKGEIFEKLVDLPLATQKIYYKVRSENELFGVPNTIFALQPES